MADREEFRKLLAEAIHRIRACEANKPISVVHDELGHALGKAGAGTAIAYWRKGKLPQVHDLAQLAREIIKRADLDRAWLRRFLATADYPYAENLCNELFPIAAPANALTADPLPMSHVPFTKAYRALLGREPLINEILTVLSDPDARSIVAIDGVGGIGKTALAQEVVLSARQKKLFSTVVWVSGAKGNRPSGTSVNSFTFNTVLNAIGNELNLPDLLQLTETEKANRIHALLRRHRILVVLDNLETAAEAQTEIVQKLQPLLGISRALLTSRQRFAADLYAIHLEGLAPTAAHQFLRQEGQDRRVHSLATARDAELTQITQVTGASPLAMKLVVGQLGFLTLDLILTHLQAVKPLSRNSETDEYLNLYKYIYFPSWGLLSELGKDLLVAMAPFVPGVGGLLPALQAVSGMTTVELPTYTHELWRLSLLEIGEASPAGLGEKRYYLHALTRHFVLSDIVNSEDL